jgi:hypothetical protein
LTRFPVGWEQVTNLAVGHGGQGINPFDHLKDLFPRLPAAKITQIKELTPAAWVNANKKMVAHAT